MKLNPSLPLGSSSEFGMGNDVAARKFRKLSLVIILNDPSVNGHLELPRLADYIAFHGN